jgi:acyl-CoA reductase-like NAD-dependent aldehyde dehydrogenase
MERPGYYRDAIVKVGQTALPTTSATPTIERSRILLQAVALLSEHNDELS